MKINLKLRRAAQSLPFRQTLKQILGVAKQPLYRRRFNSYHRNALRALNQPRILVIMNGGIGNAVEATPMVQAIRTAQPKSRITLLAPFGDLFDNWCVVNEIVTSIASLADRSFNMTFVTQASRLTEAELRSTLDAGEVVEMQYSGMQFVKPERDYNLSMVRGLGYGGDAPPLYVSMKQPSVEIPQASPKIAIVPGGKPEEKWKHKRWPFYPELAEELLRKYPRLQLTIIGTEDDYFEYPAVHTDRIVDLRGQLTLAETAWLLRHTTLAVGNDCGPMHIADAVQTKALVIFGATCELKNGPLYRAVPVVADVSCRPCQYEDRMLTCQTSRCLTEITIAVMMERIEMMLRSVEI